MQDAETTFTQPVSEAGIEFYRRRYSRTSALTALLSITIIFLVSALYQPSQPGADGEYFTVCLFKNFSGLPCPGCGLTHSFCAIGKGNLEEAFRFNLLGPVAFFLALLVWLRSALVLTGRTGPVALMDRAASRLRLIPTLALAFILFGLARIAYILAR
jgi:hypothetical protein